MSAADPRSSRSLGATEQSWCRAVAGGTGITVLALLLSKPPELMILKTAINNLQNSHPILRSRLRLNRTTQSFSFAVPEESPALEVESYDLESTLKILQFRDSSLPAFQTIIEHEINVNLWEDVSKLSSVDGIGVFHAKAYEIEGGRRVVTLKLHTAACDRAAAVVVLKELMGLIKGGRGGAEMEIERNLEVKMGIEDYIPRGKGNKPFWARGVDMLGYSLNSFRLANIDFVDPDSPRRSELVRFRLEPTVTISLLEGCKKRGIKLCGLVAAAGLMAARQCKRVPEGQWEKFAVVTLTDCRPFFQPPLTSHDIGFYHSAILNTHDINGMERPWELAKKIYNSFLEAKNANKHFTDMADLNSLMCKAIDNPGLTPSSSLRTSFISMFEDVVMDDADVDLKHMGVEDCMGCSSVHGVGPTLALFDTIREGRFDCTCVYPAPLHSRAQMDELVGYMKRILEKTMQVGDVEASMSMWMAASLFHSVHHLSDSRSGARD
ncbi:hypothetical protein V2J09_009698 [Rumex salicifolius]